MSTQQVATSKKRKQRIELQTRSFMKAAFTGSIDEHLVFPYPYPSPEEIEEIEFFAKELDKFCQKNIDGAQIDLDSQIPQKVLDGLAELGVFSLTVPEEYEGLDVSQSFFCRAMGVIPKYCASTSATIVAHLSIGTKALYMYGTAQQKEKYYPKLVTGEWIAAFSLTEPQAGSDASGITTTARLSEDGSHYVLSGEKIYVTNGAMANLFTVFAKIVSGEEEERGFTAFLVTRDMAGVSTGKEEKKLGLRGSSTTPLYLDNVKVPVENVLGEKGKGFKIAMELLNSGRLGLAAICAGGIHKCIAEVSQYVKQRKQFGKSLSEFGLIQKKISRMAALAYAMESSVYLTAALADQGEVDFSIESAICKIFTAEAAWEIVNESVQALGGNGFISDFPYERALRDSRITMIFEGTNEILRLFIALAGMKDIGKYLKKIGEAVNHPVQYWGVLYQYISSQVTGPFLKERISNVSPQLDKETAQIEKNIRLLNQVVERALRKYKKDILHQQFLLERIADMAISIYTLTACISRVDKKLKEEREETSPTLEYERRCLSLYSAIAEESFQKSYQGVYQNHDEQMTAISDYICEQEKYPFKLWPKC